MNKLTLKSPAFENGDIQLGPDDMPVVLGRSKHANITINDEQLSRKHSEIRLNAVGLFELFDLDSMNLTIVNRKDVTAHVLQDGDQILLGDTEILVQVELVEEEISDRTTRDLTLLPGENDETIGN